MLSEFRLIQTVSDLNSLCNQLTEETILGVDTEADSLYHYFPKVCLIQISTSQHTFVVDPLAIQTMDALRPLFADNKIKKIFHGADYDIRSLFRDFAAEVNNLFDTMVASQFLGEKEPALAVVVKKRFDTTLNKKYQRANWSKRPLSRDMIQYAGRDTAYLIRLYKELTQELQSKGRLNWVEEECEILSNECTVKDNPAGGGINRQNPCNSIGHSVSKKTLTPRTPLFRQFKGAGKLAPRDLAVLEKILIFRERLAIEQDRPLFRIFSNAAIQNIVTAKPRHLAALRKVPNLPGDFMGRYAEGVLEAIKSALELPDDRLPSFPKTRSTPQSPEKQARLKRLKSWRNLKARQLELETGLICNNVLLHALAEGNPKDVEDLKVIPRMRVWQMKTLGQEIIEVLKKVS
jgi:ribonuclease D